MNAAATMTGQRNHGNDPSLPLPLPLTETDMINVDKFKLAQVIRNLVSNALKFSPRDSVATLHAVFAPSLEAVVAVGERPISSSSSARQMMRQISARLRRKDSVSAEVAPPTSNVIALPPTNQFTAGFLRISVIDHG